MNTEHLVFSSFSQSFRPDLEILHVMIIVACARHFVSYPAQKRLVTSALGYKDSVKFVLDCDGVFKVKLILIRKLRLKI